MRDVKRIKRICTKLEKIWSRHPDMRFTQLLWKIGLLNKNSEGRMLDPFYVEDSVLESLLGEEEEDEK